MGWLALQLALGDASGRSSNGRLHELAEQPFGEVLMWLVAVGMFLLVLWRLIEQRSGTATSTAPTRCASGSRPPGRCGIYGDIALSAATIAAGAGSSGGGSDSHDRRELMDLPAGQSGWSGRSALAIIGYGVGPDLRVA